MAKMSVISTEIPANQALSGVVDLGSHTLVAIEMPEAWAGTTITFQSKAKVAEDVTNSVGVQQNSEDLDDVYDSAGAEISMTVSGGKIVVPTAAHAAALAPLRFLRVRSGTSAAPFNQNPTRIIRFLVKEG